MASCTCRTRSPQTPLVSLTAVRRPGAPIALPVDHTEPRSEPQPRAIGTSEGLAKGALGNERTAKPTRTRAEISVARSRAGAAGPIAGSRANRGTRPGRH